MFNKSKRAGYFIRNRRPQRFVFVTGLAVLALLFPMSSDNARFFPLPGAVIIGPEELPKVKPEPKVKKSPCCRLGIAYRCSEGLVVLDRICPSRKKTIVHLRTVNLSRVCTYPPRTFILDEKKRKYRMVAHLGLPHCDLRTNRKPNVRFRWTFQPLAKGVRRITLIEEQSAMETNFKFWVWRNVDLKKCIYK